MKKIFLIFVLLTPIMASAATMCAKNDSVLIVLDPSIRATDSGFDSTTKTWWQQFPYGRVYGTYACLDKHESGFVPKLTDTNGKRVVGGEGTGRYCWCKMTNPVSSQWKNVYTISTTNKCITDCGAYCKASAPSLIESVSD